MSNCWSLIRQYLLQVLSKLFRLAQILTRQTIHGLDRLVDLDLKISHGRSDILITALACQGLDLRQATLGIAHVQTSIPGGGRRDYQGRLLQPGFYGIQSISWQRGLGNTSHDD